MVQNSPKLFYWNNMCVSGPTEWPRAHKSLLINSFISKYVVVSGNPQTFVGNSTHEAAVQINIWTFINETVVKEILFQCAARFNKKRETRSVCHISQSACETFVSCDANQFLQQRLKWNSCETDTFASQCSRRSHLTAYKCQDCVLWSCFSSFKSIICHFNIKWQICQILSKLNAFHIVMALENFPSFRQCGI